MVDLNIPVGVSDFEKLRENNYYYIDKTGFISKLLQTKSAEVTLITPVSYTHLTLPTTSRV